MEEGTGDERRSDRRLRLPLELKWESGSGKHDARVYDIGVSGCYVESISSVTTGEHVRMEIQLPGGHWLKLEGEVVHHQPGMGFALRFANLSRLDGEILARLTEAGGERL